VAGEKEMRRYLLFIVMVALVSGGIGRAASTPQSDAKTQQTNTKTAKTKKDTPTSNQESQPTGDDVFKAHCSRCHVPPMSISPRITGTVVMHMRTRARLSREDEIQLLKFMAP
jgi:cytochrome c5